MMWNGQKKTQMVGRGEWHQSRGPNPNPAGHQDKAPRGW